MSFPRIATVFGGTGFLGHAVVQALAAQGFIVRVPTRDPENANDLKVLGKTGQVVPLPVSLRTDAAVAAALAESEIVINLIGIMAEKGRCTFQNMHVETAARIARLARADGVRHFVHVSALGADVRSKSRYAKTKALGEDAVRAFYPEAVILRPSLMFGPRDKFFNMFAFLGRFMPFLPLIGGGNTKFQPVYVGDVASVIIKTLDRPEAKGRIYALGGPRVYTFKELLLLIGRATGQHKPLIPVPWFLAKMKAFFLEFLPEPPLTRDQVELLKTDNIVSQRTSGAARGVGIHTIEELGIEPLPLEPYLTERLAAQSPAH